MEEHQPESALEVAEMVPPVGTGAAAPAAPPARPGLLRRFLGAPFHWLHHAAIHPRQTLRWTLLLLAIGAAAWFGGWRGYGWYHLDAARRCLERDHCSRAIEHVQAALAVWPDDPEVLFLAAQAARRGGDVDVAEHYLARCEAAPVLAGRAARERLLLRATRGEVDEVGDYCRALLAQDDADAASILEALAQGNMVALRFPEASADLDRWLELSPDHPQGLYLKGCLAFGASNQQDAIGLFERVLELDPERDDARTLLATLYLDMARAQEALPHLEQLLKDRPGTPATQARLARCLDLLGRQAEASALLDDVLRRHPNLAPALLERGRLALRAGDTAMAEDYLQRACDQDPGNSAARYQLFRCLKQRNKPLEAKAALEQANQLQRDLERLQVIASREMSRRPHDAGLRAEAGAILVRSGMLPQGARWLESALRIDPQNPAAHRAFAHYYQVLGQLSRAEHHRALAGDLSTKDTKEHEEAKGKKSGK